MFLNVYTANKIGYLASIYTRFLLQISTHPVQHSYSKFTSKISSNSIHTILQIHFIMSSNSENTVLLSGTFSAGNARGDSQAGVETSNISSPPSPRRRSTSTPNYGTFGPPLHKEDRPRKLSSLKSSVVAFFKIHLWGHNDDDDGGFNSNSLPTQQREIQSMPRLYSLSSECFCENGLFLP